MVAVTLLNELVCFRAESIAMRIFPSLQIPVGCRKDASIPTPSTFPLSPHSTKTCKIS